jgi:hypothetical protein
MDVDDVNHGDIVEFSLHQQQFRGIVAQHVYDLCIHYFLRGQLRTRYCLSSDSVVVLHREVGIHAANLIEKVEGNFEESLTLATNVAKALLRTYFPDDPNLVWS